MSQSWQTWRHLEDCLNNMMYCCFSVLLLLSHFQPFKYTVFGAVWIIFMFPETYFNIMHCLFAGVDLLLRVDELMNSTWLASLSQLPQTFFYYAFRLGKDLWIMWCPFPDWTSRLPSKHGEVWMLRYIFTFYRNAIPVFLKKKKKFSSFVGRGFIFKKSDLLEWLQKSGIIHTLWCLSKNLEKPLQIVELSHPLRRDAHLQCSASQARPRGSPPTTRVVCCQM